ncbi:MAG: DUF5020 family protein [Bacteroidales bacterium]|nr:DUF5020 family protein [Bacteroidales bacterium]
MKKLYVILLILFLTSSVPAISQNVQLHYRTGQWLYPDTLGKDARILTTVEMFRMDPWGDTFLFVDMTYTPQGVNYAYWEIARNLKFWDAPVAVHLEYNGGLLGSILFNHSWLAGVNYGIASKDGSKSFSISAMYKYIQGLSRPSNFQLTAIWNMDLAGGKCTFSGFVDWWRQGDKFILLSQPQFWVNLNAFEGISDSFCLSVGTEVELNSNLFYKGFYVIPTLAVKWTFR